MVNTSESFEKKPKKTVTASFRIDEESLVTLQEEAERNRVSLNTLVNQILTFYVKADHFEQARLVKMSDIVFARVLNATPEDELMRISSERADEYAKVLIKVKYGEFNLTNILRYMYDLCQYWGWGTYSERHLERGRRLVTIEHRLGKKGSIWLSNIMKTLIETMGFRAEITSTEVAATIEIQNVGL